MDEIFSTECSTMRHTHSRNGRFSSHILYNAIAFNKVDRMLSNNEK